MALHGGGLLALTLLRGLFIEFATAQLAEYTGYLNQQLHGEFDFGNIIGESAALNEVLSKVEMEQEAESLADRINSSNRFACGMGTKSGRWARARL